jgi:hypothetical protein
VRDTLCQNRHDLPNVAVEIDLALPALAAAAENYRSRRELRDALILLEAAPAPREPQAIGAGLI